MKGPDQTRRLLERLVGGDVPDRAIVEELRNEHNECQWLDFKSGELFNDRDKRAKIRWEVAGFGNAEGGIVMAGVADAPPRSDGDPERAFAPCPEKVGNQALHLWVRDAVGDMHAYFSPVPRYAPLVNFDGARVLIVAVPRAPALIPVHDGGRLVYPIRIDDQTRPMPEYLAADLILGRRNRPILRLHIASDPAPRQSRDSLSGDKPPTLWRGYVQFIVENVSLQRAYDARGGIIYWQHISATSQKQVTDQMRSMLDAPSAEEMKAHDLRLVHQQFSFDAGGWNQGPRQPGPPIEPLDQSPSASRPEINILVPGAPGQQIEIAAAVYLMNRDSIPEWYQLIWASDREPQLEKLWGALPKVNWARKG